MENNIDYMHNGKHCLTMQDLLNVLCDEYGLDRISINLKFRGDFSKGRFFSDEKQIELNQAFMVDGHFSYSHIEVVYHEFRHYWQMKKYPDVYNWWLREHGDFYEELTNMKNKEGKQLSHIICELEKDAQEFGKSYGKRNCEDLLKKFDIKTADICKYRRQVQTLLKNN